MPFIRDISPDFKSNTDLVESKLKFYSKVELVKFAKIIIVRNRNYNILRKNQIINYIISEGNLALKNTEKIDPLTEGLRKTDSHYNSIESQIKIDDPTIDLKLDKKDNMGKDTLTDIIISTIKPELDLHIDTKIDKEFTKEKITSRVKQALLEVIPRQIEVHNIENNKKKLLPEQHHTFDKLLKFVSTRTNSYLVGPAGSGKTKAAFEVAKALDLAFYSMSVGPMTTQTQIMGYMDAIGKYVPSIFRKAYQDGGIFLFDEIDSANSSVFTCINQATSSDICSFPDGMISRNKDFICLAAANTYGKGADRIYIGRNQLDGATLDRFSIIEWEIDEKLELRISTNETWTKKVQKIRKVILKEKIRHLVTPRASIAGGQLLSAGIPESEVEDAVIWKGLDIEQVKKIKALL